MKRCLQVYPSKVSALTIRLTGCHSLIPRHLIETKRSAEAKRHDFYLPWARASLTNINARGDGKVTSHRFCIESGDTSRSPIVPWYIGTSCKEEVSDVFSVIQPWWSDNVCEGGWACRRTRSWSKIVLEYASWVDDAIGWWKLLRRNLAFGHKVQILRSFPLAHHPLDEIEWIWSQTAAWHEDCWVNWISLSFKNIRLDKDLWVKSLKQHLLRQFSRLTPEPEPFALPWPSFLRKPCPPWPAQSPSTKTTTNGNNKICTSKSHILRTKPLHVGTLAS